MFEKVRLMTRDNRLVADVIIPRFTPAADMLLWGERWFVFREERRGRKIYHEGMMWHVQPQAQYAALEQSNAT